jgi:hypothetical protein
MAAHGRPSGCQSGPGREAGTVVVDHTGRSTQTRPRCHGGRRAGDEFVGPAVRAGECGLNTVTCFSRPNERKPTNGFLNRVSEVRFPPGARRDVMSRVMFDIGAYPIVFAAPADPLTPSPDR